MAQQTAVDWLIDQIESKGDAWENASIRILQISIDISDYLDLKKQAKAMEQQHIKDAVIYGLDEDGHTGDWKISVAQKYYNEKHLEITGLPGGDK